MDHLRAQVKKLKSENRHLKKLLKHSEKWKNLKEDIHVEEVDGDSGVVVEKVDECPKCSIGKLRFFDFPHLKLFACDNKECDYRERSKKK